MSEFLIAIALLCNNDKNPNCSKDKINCITEQYREEHGICVGHLCFDDQVLIMKRCFIK